MENSNPGQGPEIKVVILSAGRPEAISTPFHIANTLVCVPEGQEGQYKAVNPELEYIPHPDEITSLAGRMQWLYDKLKNVFILDDNIIGCQAIYTDGTSIDPIEAYELIQRAGETCRRMGKYLFGFSQYPNPKHYNQLKPFKISGFIPGNAIGLLVGSGLKFNEQIIQLQAQYINGMNAHLHKMVFQDTRFHFKVGKSSNVSSNQIVQDNITELNDLILLRKLFGDAIRIKNAPRGKKGYVVSLSVPF